MWAGGGGALSWFSWRAERTAHGAHTGRCAGGRQSGGSKASGQRRWEGRRGQARSLVHVFIRIGDDGGGGGSSGSDSGISIRMGGARV